MIYSRFLSLCLFTFLLNAPLYSQFNLVKDFDGSTQSSFTPFHDNGILYSIGTKIIVKYDSFNVDGQHTPIYSLAAVDAGGNNQRLAYSLFNTVDQAPFSDFKTLPNGKVAFIVVESNISFKVLITDGTAAGTIAAYTAPSPIKGLELIDNGLYFTHHDNTGHSLMKIDLTTLVASEVATFGTFHAISDISKVSNTALVFLAPDPADDKLKLYVSDGTAAGTTALTVINSGSAVVEDAFLNQVGNNVYFFSKLPDVTCCSALWVTDGTVAGTQKLKEINVLYSEQLIDQRMAIGWKNKFYFAGVEKDATTDQTLWVSDGTVAGTSLLMPPSEENIHPRHFTVFKDALYFITVNGKDYENKLYKTDGTVAGTVPIELKHSEYVLSPYSFVAYGDYLYMGAGDRNASFVAELYRYDGVHTQCDKLEGEPGATGDSHPSSFFVHGSDLYFTAYLNATGEELYTIGGDFTSSVTTDTKSRAANAFIVYPNPATDQVSIKSSEKIKSLRLVNQFGNVLTETTDSMLRLDGYSEGVYFIEVQLMNGEIGFQKIALVK